MSPLVWTAAPLAVTLLAAVWVFWRARPRRLGDAVDTVEEHARFRAALARGAGRGPAVGGQAHGRVSTAAAGADRPDTLA